MIPHIKMFTKKHMKTDIQKLKWFQVIGIDIILDADCNAWLMEVNANPSLNMYLGTFKTMTFLTSSFIEKIEPDGTKSKILSELDKHLKTTVLDDALKIVKWKDQPDTLGCFEKILPLDSDPKMEQYYISNPLYIPNLYNT